MNSSSVAILSVTELNLRIKERLESDPRLVRCYVSGEISNFKHHGSGHMYFSLKDETSRLRAIMFSSKNRGLAFTPQDGMRVICAGTLGVFERDGQYQLYVDELQPDGIGALYVKFTQLRDRLAAEGVFDPGRKRTLPVYPRRIGVVTSPTGAVIRDICSTLARRYPLANIALSPALVQGPGAAASLVAALDRLVRWSDTDTDGDHRIDVVIIGRGGGSLEELWPFNEEAVARAVFHCPIPVVSAVGHETDVTICDFTADVRAATPTAAAELVAPHVQDVRDKIHQAESRLGLAWRWKADALRRQLATLRAQPALATPLRMVDRRRQTLDYVQTQLQPLAAHPLHAARRKVGALAERLYRADVAQRVTLSRARVDRLNLSAHERTTRRLLELGNALERTVIALEALNPLTVLRRGYSVVYAGESDQIVYSRADVSAGALVRIRFADGFVRARVESGEESSNAGQQSKLDI